MVAYATDSDLLLGDLELSASVSTALYLERASRDVDLALSRMYVTPIPTADPVTAHLLSSVTADLASAYLLLAVAQGGEDNHVNAYGQHLYARAWDRLRPYLNGDLSIPGATLVPVPTQAGPVAITQEDSRSLVEAFYKFVGDTSYVPRMYPAVAPYDTNTN